MDPSELTLRDFARSLRARNRSPKTIESYLSAAGQLASFRPGADVHMKPAEEAGRLGRPAGVGGAETSAGGPGGADAGGPNGRARGGRALSRGR